MLLCMAGPKEADNRFKAYLASYFNCPVFQFRDLSEQLFSSFSGLFGLNKFTSTKSQDEIKLLLRENLTKFHPSTYIDWMSQQLVDKIFKRQENSSKIIQGIVLDVETVKEYKTLRSFLLSPKFGKHNKFILVENEDIAYTHYNKDYKTYNEFEIDEVISNEDEEVDKSIQGWLKKWHLELPKTLAPIS